MRGRLLSAMSKDLLLPYEVLDYLVRSAPYRYKVYQVSKRSGSGMRTIAQPAKEVKKLQYWVMENIFPCMPIHPSAIAYVRGNNIRKNCEPHANNPFMLKIDFRDFFPSIKGDDFFKYASGNKNVDFDEEDLKSLTKILFWRPKEETNLILSIGAPSSPYLSNAIMHNFDSRINDYCSEVMINYTRYADDITFSMEDQSLRGLVLLKVKEILDQLPFPKLEINSKKTVFGSKAHRRMITGLILANNGEISIGRDKKRLIRAQIHYFINGKLTVDQQNKLRGMLAYISDIEPDFFRRLERKYGHEVLAHI
jgi:RNA-directed DNA polymerase